MNAYINNYSTRLGMYLAHADNPPSAAPESNFAVVFIQSSFADAYSLGKTLHGTYISCYFTSFVSAVLGS